MVRDGGWIVVVKTGEAVLISKRIVSRNGCVFHGILLGICNGSPT